MDLSEVTGRNRGIDKVAYNAENTGRHLRQDYMSSRGSSSYGDDGDSISQGRAGVLRPAGDKARGSSYKEGSYATSMQYASPHTRLMEFDKNNLRTAVNQLEKHFGGTSYTAYRN